MAFAYDRKRVVDGFGGNTATVTCQLLPPNSPAYRPYCPYTLNPTNRGAWTAPDVAAARKLVAASGTQGMHVDVLGMSAKVHPPEAVLTSVLDETLRRLGYRTSVKRLPTYGDYYPAAHKAASRVEAAFGEGGAQYPSPGDYLTNLLSCSLSFSPRYSCTPSIDRKLRETLALQAREPQNANAAWARLERELVDQAVLVPVVNPKGTEFVSKRLGNYQPHPYFGMLISQVWVR